MKQDAVDKAAAMLLAARLGKYQIDCLPQEIRPANMEDAYAIQRCLYAQLGGRCSGWFLGGTNGESSTPTPFAAPILPGALRKGPATINNFMSWYIDVEFGFMFGTEVKPRKEPYTDDEILSLIASVHPTLDIVNSHFKNLNEVGWPSMIADNGSDGAVIYGESITNWQPDDLNKLSIILYVDGVPMKSGSGQRIMGNPVNALIWFVRYMSKQNHIIAAGEFLATGCCTDVYSGRSGEHLKADFGAFGAVEALLAN